MIDLEDYIIKKGRKYFHIWCNICGADKGYKNKESAERSCYSCNGKKANQISQQSKKENPRPIHHCSIEGCDNKHHGKGYCEKHYNEFVRKRDDTVGICKICNKHFVLKQSKHYFYCSDECKKNRKYVSGKIKRRKSIDKAFQLFKYRIRHLIGERIRYYGYTKKSSASSLLQCSYQDFKNKIGECPGIGYQLDHICPCAQAQNEEEFIKLQHYMNFRWLSAEENLKKSNNKTPEAEQKCIELLGREWIDV